MSKYITVLDFEVSRVFQYKVKDRFINNGDYEEFISNKGHRLNNCEWMVHDIAGIIKNNDGDYDGGECSVCGTTAPRIFNTN